MTQTPSGISARPWDDSIAEGLDTIGDISNYSISEYFIGMVMETGAATF